MERTYNAKNEEQLERLFGLSRDAVIGVRDGCVVFTNPAADVIFGQEPKAPALPRLLLESELDHFVCLAALPCGTRQVSGVRQDGLLLLTIPQEDAPMALIPGAILNQLRTTAYNLRMTADLIVSRSGADQRLSEYASAMYHNYYSMLRLTDDLADASAISAGRLPCRRRSADLSALCRTLAESVSFFTADSGARVLWQGDEGPCLALLDRSCVEQMLLGLFSGAIQRGAKTVRLGLHRHGQSFILSVDDDGTAIPNDRFSRAFSLWSRQDAYDVPDCGEDIGFYIAQGIAALHDGTMLLQSREGDGTRVRISLPGTDRLLLRDSGATVSAAMLLKALSPVLDRKMYQRRFMD